MVSGDRVIRGCGVYLHWLSQLRGGGELLFLSLSLSLSLTRVRLSLHHYLIVLLSELVTNVEVVFVCCGEQTPPHSVIGSLT